MKYEVYFLLLNTIVPNRQVFPTFIFCLLFAAEHCSSPALCLRCQWEQEWVRVMHGGTIDRRFSAGGLAAGHEQY